MKKFRSIRSVNFDMSISWRNPEIYDSTTSPYVANDPVNAVDPDGQFLDTLFDVVSIVADVAILVYDEVANGGENRAENLVALGADIASAAVPFVAGGGLAVRSARAADNAVDSLQGGRAADKATCCFVAGTLVDTEAGLRPIESVDVGDKVWSQDVETGEVQLKTVTDLVQRHQRSIWVVKVADSTGFVSRFETTADHPWWVTDVGWVSTGDLVRGLIVASRNNSRVEIVSVERTDVIDLTFNLTVQGFHTYFVGNSRVLVHNCPYYSRTKREEGFENAGGKCEYCGRDTQMDTPFQKDSAEGDHFIPQSRGGDTTDANFVNSCRECNGPGNKGNKMPGDESEPSNPNDRVKEMIEDRAR